MKQSTSLSRPSSAASAPSCKLERSLLSVILSNGLWLIGLPACLFGLLHRGVVLFTEDTILIPNISYFLITCVLFVSWLCFRPGGRRSQQLSRFAFEQTSNSNPRHGGRQLSFVASQLHRLPFPYVCQIYHLLNLKHLEDIHSVSLGNLKVVGVSHLQPTQAGGRLRFKTMLDSPLNVLRIWRQTSVEVELVLHTPYQVELKIPAYLGKQISVLFNVLPLGEREHYLLIQMYSDLRWPAMLLRGVLLLAASFTLLEDLPYLRKLAQRNPHRLTRSSNLPHQSMQLFQRYMELYGSHLKQLQGLESVPTETLRTVQAVEMPDEENISGPWWCNEILQPFIVGASR